MRNPYYERMLVYFGKKFEEKFGNSPLVLLKECPNIKKIKGSPAVFELINNVKPFEWTLAVYIYEELETEDSPMFQIIQGMVDSGSLNTLIEGWLQSVVDYHIYEKRKDDEGTRVQDS